MQIAYLIKKKSYEKIEYVLRRHSITFLPIILLFFLILAVPVVVYLMINYLYPEIFFNKVIFTLGILLISSYFLGAYLFFYTQFIDFYLDIWIVTNDRIVDIEQFGLFSRTISELDLFRIQDVTTNVHGFFATVFHYGDIQVKTASANINIVFRNVPRPNEVREKLIRLSEEDRKYHYNNE